MLSFLKDFDFLRNLPDYFDEEERRLVVRSVVIGVVVWAIVYALRTAVHWTFHQTLHWLEHGPSPFLAFIPLLGAALFVAAISQYRASIVHYRDADGEVHELIDVEGDGLERAISLYYASEPSIEQVLQGKEGLDVRWQLPTFSLVWRKFVATLATLGSGGSGGLEASVALIGESVAAGLFKPRKALAQAEERVSSLRRLTNWWAATHPDDLQTAQLSGIAAAVSTLLGAPFAAAFFAAEVMYRQRPLIEKLVYSLISSLVAYFLTNIVSGGHPAMFEVETLYVPPGDVRYFLILMLMGTAVALISIYFSRLRARIESAFHRHLPNIWQRHLTGAAITGIIAVTVAITTKSLGLTEHGLELVLGPGEGVIDLALAGELTLAVALIALVAKMVATLATIGSGGSAGLLVPSLFFGTMVATAVAQLFHIEPMLLIIPAMTASLVAIVNVPLAAILFVVETFGAAYMLPSLIVLVVTSILAHNNTIYRTQRETFDRRQILPGVGVRRIPVPTDWHGKTLIDLNFRQQFDLTVIGLVELNDDTLSPRIRLGTAATTPLESGDILVVLGREEKLDGLEQQLKLFQQK